MTVTHVESLPPLRIETVSEPVGCAELVAGVGKVWPSWFCGYSVKRWKRAKNLSVVYAVKASGSHPWSAGILTGTAINSRKPASDNVPSPYPSIRLSILLAALGLCVFFWGLGYKLSLYETHLANLHRIPEAKLLSHNEDRSAAEGVRLCLAKAVTHHQDNPCIPFLFLWLVSIAGLCVRRDWHSFSISRPWCLRLGVIRSASYFRPPPVLLPAIIL